jgi:SAM-dependent methyltransferase
MARTVVGLYRSPSSFPWYDELEHRVAGRRTLEVGGPSPIFRSEGRVPVYPMLGSWDNVDFSPVTLWRATRGSAGDRVSNGSAEGRQLYGDARCLDAVPAASYQLVLSSHVLEHLTDPIRALREWRRILAADGAIVAVVPEGARTFDHARPPTELGHLQEDYARGVPEDDLEHLPEILASHDLGMDPDAGTKEEFAERSRRNAEFRALHHHVFTPRSFASLLDASGYTVRTVVRVPPYHVLAVGDVAPR